MRTTGRIECDPRRTRTESGVALKRSARRCKRCASLGVLEDGSNRLLKLVDAVHDSGVGAAIGRELDVEQVGDDPAGSRAGVDREAVLREVRLIEPVRNTAALLFCYAFPPS